MGSHPLSTLLGIDHPIVLGPFGGLSSIDLTAAVSNGGGLGSYGLYGYSPADIVATIHALRGVTGSPFAVNLWLPTGDEVVPGDVAGQVLEPARTVLAPLFAELGMELPDLPAAFLPEAEAQLDAALESRPAVLSLVYGVPPGWVIERARAQRTIVIGTATTVAEARALEAGGVDAIVATGAEAAGHRTAFLRDPAAGLIGTFALVPQVCDAVSVPVIAAGGIADARGVSAAFALGAAGVQVGTAFLVTDESAAATAYRDAIRGAAAEDLVLTTAMSGRLARGVANHALTTIETGGAIAPFPAQNWLTGQFRKVAGTRNRGDLLSLWAGQGAPLATGTTAEAVLNELIRGVPLP